MFLPPCPQETETRRGKRAHTRARTTYDADAVFFAVRARPDTGNCCGVRVVCRQRAGICKRQLVCGRGSVYEETGERCNCNEALATGGVARTCKRCYARKEPRAGGVYYTNPKGVLTECRSCKAPHLMHRGKCILREACPPAMARYLVGSMGGRCEAPFACVRGKRDGGESPGGTCKCSSSSLCRDCTWRAGRDEQQCTMCKKHTLLLDGRCIGEAECIGLGLVPVSAKRGGRCLASGAQGTDE